MKIINTIYSSHLTNDNTPDAELRDAAKRLGDFQAAALCAAYPDADIETVVRHGVSGVGAGVSVVMDDGSNPKEIHGSNPEEIQEQAQAIADRVGETAEIWA